MPSALGALKPLRLSTNLATLFYLNGCLPCAWFMNARGLAGAKRLNTMTDMGCSGSMWGHLAALAVQHANRMQHHHMSCQLLVWWAYMSTCESTASVRHIPINARFCLRNAGLDKSPTSIWHFGHRLLPPSGIAAFAQRKPQLRLDTLPRTQCRLSLH